MKKGFNFKLNLAATAVLMTTGVANAGVANVNGTGTESNPYNMGIIGTSPSILAVTLNGTPGSSFSEYAVIGDIVIAPSATFMVRTVAGQPDFAVYAHPSID